MAIHRAQLFIPVAQVMHGQAVLVCSLFAVNSRHVFAAERQESVVMLHESSIDMSEQRLCRLSVHKVPYASSSTRHS